MLKIIDNVDLKELKKFGFEKAEYPDSYFYYKKNIDYGSDACVAVCCQPQPQDRLLLLDAWNESEYIDEWADVIYELTNAGLVEKVEGK